MSCIHGKDTKPEEIVRKYLFSKGFRYRKNDKKLPGSPDVVLPKYRTVIFVNVSGMGMMGADILSGPKTMRNSGIIR